MGNHVDGVIAGANIQNNALIQPHENNAASRVSIAFGRAWEWVKRHPSWTPVVSTGTGFITGVTYFVIATVAAVALVGGIFLGAISSFIPVNNSAKQLKEFSIKLIAACENFLSTGLRLSVRGFVSTVPGFGNVIIFIADRYNRKNQDEEYLWFLLEER